MMNNSVYVTTPIYYVNAKPHIGTAYTTLITDTIARYWRKKLNPEFVYFLTGTDENSQKTLDAAEKAGVPVGAYLDDMAGNFIQCWENIGIQYDDFIRTTEPRHHETVGRLIQKIYDAGDIYLGDYEGLYCSRCESFLKESELTADGCCQAHLVPPQKIKEKNYFFRLKKYAEPLKKLLEGGFLKPAKRANELLSFIDEGLEDISITREGAEIGIPFAPDVTHKLYVWVEALMNYYTAIDTEEKRHFWDSAVHIVGKDITRFHCLIWPAMLMSAQISLPQGVFAHGFFTVNGTKMSKSLGNVIDPEEMAAKWGKDALRVGVLSAFSFGNDGDFSMDTFAETYRTKLAGGIGNLMHRVITLMNKYYEGMKPMVSVTVNVPEVQAFEVSMESLSPFQACEAFFALIARTNQYLNDTSPWKIADKQSNEAHIVFATLLQYLEALVEMAAVLTPETYPRMRSILGNAERVGTSEILFPAVE